jgi:dCTP deaminase
MAVLGRGQIITRMRVSRPDRKLVVSPILAEGQIGAGSIDLRMGNVVLMVRARGASHVDPADASHVQPTKNDTSHDFEVGRHQKHERYEIPFDTKFLLHPGSLALVPTLMDQTSPGYYGKRDGPVDLGSGRPQYRDSHAH